MQVFKTRFSEWSLKEGVNNFKSKTVEKFLEIEGVLPRLVKRILK